MKSKGQVFTLIFCTVAFSGCATQSKFAAISSKNVNVTNMQVGSSNKGRAYGEDCQHIVILIPTSGAPTIDEAIDRALEAKRANLLTNAVVNFHTFYIPYVYGQTCWSVEGDAHDTYE